ncbi:MAG: PKD domain-containing protein [bacterium]|nr:PKD domain-containing protein [bacterium]
MKKVRIKMAMRLVCAMAWTSVAMGATATWTGGGSDNFWTTPGNWQGGYVPAGGDNVIFGYNFVPHQSVKLTNYWTGAPASFVNTTQVVWEVELPSTDIYINFFYVTNNFTVGGSDQLALHNEDATLVISNGVTAWCNRIVNAKCKVRFEGDQTIAHYRNRLEYWGNVKNERVLTKIGSVLLRFRNAGPEMKGTIVVADTGALQGGFASDYSIGTARIVFTNTGDKLWVECIAPYQEVFLRNDIVIGGSEVDVTFQSTGPASGRPGVVWFLGNISGKFGDTTKYLKPRVSNFDCIVRLAGTNFLGAGDVNQLRTDSDGIIEVYRPEAIGDQDMPPNWTLDFCNGYGNGVFLCGPFTVNNMFELGVTRTNGQYAGVYGIPMLGGFHTNGTATFAGNIWLRRSYQGYPVYGTELVTRFVTTSAQARTVFAGQVYDTGGTAAGPSTLEINRYRVPLTNVLAHAIGQGVVELAYPSGNNYRGGTRVYGGTLVVNNVSGSATGTGDVHVLSGAALSGAGIIDGGVVIADNAKLAPGNSAGTLAVGSLVLNPNSVLDYELGSQAPGDYDLVVVSNDLVLDGVLNIKALPGLANGVYTGMVYYGYLYDNGLTVGSTPPGTIVNVVHDPVAKAVLFVISAPTPPTAQIVSPAGPTSVLLGASIAFSGVGATGSAPIVGYRWEFGDGTVTSGVALTSVTYTYGAAGVYTAKFVVTDANGYEGYDQRVITVDPRVTAAITQPEVAWGYKGATVHFVGVGTAQGSTITNYIWVFGDGTMASGPGLTSVNHAYGSAGLVTATFTVVNNLGDTATARIVLDIVNRVLVYEGFDYTPVADIREISAGGGEGFAPGSVWTNSIHGPGAVGVAGYGLTYINPGGFDLMTTGLCVLVGGDTNYLTRPLREPIQAPRTSGERTFWISFLMRDLGAPTVNGACYAALSTVANSHDFHPVVTAGKRWNARRFVNRPYAFTSSTVNFGPSEYDVNQTYLLLGKVTLSLTESAPRRTIGVSEWWAYQSGVDSLPTSEPVGGAVLTGTNATGVVTLQHMLVLDPPFSGEFCSMAVDELRIGENWEEVVPLIPEPGLVVLAGLVLMVLRRR